MATEIAQHIRKFVDHTMSRETAEQLALREVTMKHPNAGMMSRPEVTTLLGFLIRAISAARVIEVGTFTGFGTLSMALALPPGGRLITCDIDAKTVEIGRPFWSKAGVAERIDVRSGDAMKSLDEILKDGGEGTFDFIYIDADKTGYPAYYEAGLRLLRTNGIMAFDNMLWSGKVADPSIHDQDTDALRTLNLKMRDDPRVDCCLLSNDDGVMLACRR